MTYEFVEEAVLSAKLSETIGVMIAESGMGDAATGKEIAGWVCQLAEDFLMLLKDIDDPEQIDATTAIHYIEIKSHWIALNTRMNYQLARQGQADPTIVLKGAAVSQFLATLEPLIKSADIDAITQFLSEPIDKNAWPANEATVAEAA